MQRPLQIFSCEYCEIFINTYFEKHLWTAASENQDLVTNLPKGGISSWILSSFQLKLLVFKAFNFAMMECFFFSQTYFYHKKVHIKWNVVISSSLRLLMKVWIWCRCQNRIENYYHHDREQLGFYEKEYIKTQSKKKDVLVIFALQETNEFQFIWQKLHSRELHIHISYSTWRMLT